MNTNSKHRAILPRVIAVIDEKYPGCGILLGGSVKRGCERPDSDLDLLVVHSGNNGMERGPAWIYEGIPMCMTYFGSGWLSEAIAQNPYWFWPLAQAEILYDPRGLAHRYQASAQLYFDSRPDVADCWMEQTRRYWADKKSPSAAKKALELNEFIRMLDKKYGVATES